jgi:class 3 adenylate cyclase/tetratricopeptide (TPR) repeat protein
MNLTKISSKWCDDTQFNFVVESSMSNRLSTKSTVTDGLLPTTGVASETNGRNTLLGRGTPASGNNVSGRFSVRTCHSCGHQNGGNAKFCLNCGQALGVSCPTCGYAVPDNSRFCGQCGTRLSAEGAPTHTPKQARGMQQAGLPPGMPPALASKLNRAAVKTKRERREVTVLFLDVKNFTSTSLQLDQEDLYLFIDEALSLLVEVVHKYGGTIDKFTGDGLMALFGVPTSHENDPERAIRAALEMQAVLHPLRARLKQQFNIDFQTRIGINTGAVIAGNVGNDFHMEYTVIGNTVNLASRLETAAAPGTILVSADTFQRTSPLFKFEELSPIVARGFPEPIQAYRPLHLLRKPGRVRGIPGLQSPMIGRDQTLLQLQQVVEESTRRRRRQVVLVSGEAGVGKSRLIAEFQKSLPRSDIRIYQGNCQGYAQTTPYWVVADLLRDIIKFPEMASSKHHRTILQAYLEQIGLVNDDLLPYLSIVLGLESADIETESRLRLLDAEMLQHQTHAALRQLLLAEARIRPTILIFEDLHWVDPASRDFLEYLIKTTDKTSLLLLLVSRQQECETIVKPLINAAEATPEDYTHFQLRELLADEIQQLINNLLGQTPVLAQSLQKSIIERSNGNPFFVEEIVRMLIDQDGLVRETDRELWQITENADGLIATVPGTVQDLILARFDRLPESVKHTLQRASVLGAAFSVDLLQMLNNVSPATLKTHLNELKERQFLVSRTNLSRMNYAFQHALVQEAVYSTLLKRDRRKLHLQVARAIETGSGWTEEEKTEALAYHYSRSTETTRAIPHLLAAADLAARRCANEPAAAHYRQALKLLPESPENCDSSKDFFTIHVGLGRSLKFLGQYSEANNILTKTLEVLWNSELAAESETLWPILVEVLRLLADIREREGNYEASLAYLEAGLQVLGSEAPRVHPDLWRSLIDRMAWVRFRQGRLDEAYVLASSAISTKHLTDSSDPLKLASLLTTMASVSWQRGDLHLATSFAKRSLKLYENVGYTWGIAKTLNNLGIFADIGGDWAKAADYYDRAYHLFQNMGDLQFQSITLDNMGTLAMAMGKHQLARKQLENSRSIVQQLGDTWGITGCEVNLAHLALIEERFSDSARHAEMALTLSDNIGSTENQIQARWIMALIRAEAGELEKGLEMAREALDRTRQTGLAEKESECLRALGMLHRRGGHPTEAERSLQQSAELALSQTDPYRHGLALLELGRLYQSLARTDHINRANWRSKAEAALSKASQQFSNLGAAHDLSLTQRALSENNALPVDGATNDQ